MELKDKIAVVTGASSGVGMETAKLFARQGAKVVLTGRQNAPLKSVSSHIRSSGGEATLVEADLTSFEACEKVIRSAVNHFGRLDVLAHAAGIIANGSITSTSPEAWHEMMRVNLDATYYLMHAAAPHLEKTKGAIVNVSSVTGLRAFPNVLAYCVSKAGVDQLTRCAALDLAPKGVRVNAVNPGVVVTNLHKRGGMDDENYAKFLEHSKTTHPLGRVGNVEDIAEAILYLASSKSGWITGETLSVDGGRHLTCAR